MNGLNLEDLQSTDIYLLDQVLKGRLRGGQKVLDVGCGAGRNLRLLEKMGLEVFGIDLNPAAIQACQFELSTYHKDHFFCGEVLKSPFSKGFFDVVICNALFHFAPDRESMFSWAQKSWEGLKSGGLFFARLSTRIGLPDANPPGFNYLAEESDLEELEGLWGATRVDPLKTTLVESLRTMTTWVLMKR